MSNPDTWQAQALQTWVADELQYLWHLLEDAYRAYLNTTWLGEPTRDFRDGNDEWSMGCEGLGERIKSATELVGPVSPQNIGMSRIADGWFLWANRKLGIENPDLPDEAMMAYCQRYVDEQRAHAGVPPLYRAIC